MTENSSKHVKVHVKTSSKRERVEMQKRDILEIDVKETPERNGANKRVRELVAEHFSKPVHTVRIVRGHHSPHKIIEINN